jgi:hypothetical protein
MAKVSKTTTAHLLKETIRNGKHIVASSGNVIADVQKGLKGDRRKR